MHTNNSYNSYTYRLWVRYVSFSKLFFIYIQIIHTIHIHRDYGYDMYHLANYSSIKEQIIFTAIIMNSNEIICHMIILQIQWSL